MLVTRALHGYPFGPPSATPARMLKFLRVARIVFVLLAVALIPSACGLTSARYTAAENGGQIIGVFLFLALAVVTHVLVRRRQSR